MEDDLGSTDVGPLMFKLYKKKLYTDVMFFSMSSKKSLFAHRAVMAAKSEYFATLLFDDQEKGVSGKKMQVEITQTEFSVFKNIVHYCYTGYIAFPDDYTVLEIYAAAQSFQIVQLIDKCKTYIDWMGLARLAEDNVCSILQICNRKNFEELKQRCLSYIRGNTSNVIRSTDFEKSSFSAIRDICELPSLNLSSESELLDAILRWVNVQPRHTKKKLMNSFLKRIRFLSLSPKQFSDFMQNNDEVMSIEDGCKILTYLKNPTVEFLESLPEWCNKTMRILKTDVKNTFTDELEWPPEERKIKIYLKPTEEKHNFELTSVVHMKCLQGKHDIKGFRFSFEAIKESILSVFPAYLFINVSTITKGFLLGKSFKAKRAETIYCFPEPISLSSNETVQIEISAKIPFRESCCYLQFQNFQNSRRDFEILVSSRPSKGNLNFISEILYSTHQN